MSLPKCPKCASDTTQPIFGATALYCKNEECEHFKKRISGSP